MGSLWCSLRWQGCCLRVRGETVAMPEHKRLHRAAGYELPSTLGWKIWGTSRDQAVRRANEHSRQGTVVMTHPRSSPADYSLPRQTPFHQRCGRDALLRVRLQVGGGGVELQHGTASRRGIARHLRPLSTDARERIPTVPLSWKNAEVQSAWHLRALSKHSSGRLREEPHGKACHAVELPSLCVLCVLLRPFPRVCVM
jgi:hypothetical protein